MLSDRQRGPGADPARVSGSPSAPTLRAKVEAGYSIIAHARDYVHAVGRIPHKGSAILISLPVPQNTPRNGDGGHYGVLLTTSFVLRGFREAQGETVSFLEAPVTGATAKDASLEPVTVQLRPDIFFTTSVPEEAAAASEDEESLGYTAVACSLTDRDNPRLHIGNITPLPLPLLVSRVPAISVGDTHLLVTHCDGRSMAYVVGVVAEVHAHHCVYEHRRFDAIFSSGGPVFTDAGAFVGLQHQCGDNSFCVYVQDIVTHLFDSAMLGLCRVPLWADEEDDPELGSGTGSSATNVSTHAGSSSRGGGRLIYDARVDSEDRQRPAWLTRAALRRVGCGTQVVALEEFERHRQREQRGRSVPETLRPCTVREVWREWRSDFQSIILILHAFVYNERIVAMALRTLTAHEERHNIPEVAAMGGVGILLQALDMHPFCEALMEAGITALARISLTAVNKDALARCDGIAAITAIMFEFPSNYAVQQWGTYALLSLVTDTSRSAENILRLVAVQGVEKMVHNMRVFTSGTYLQRWSASCLAAVLACPEAFDAWLTVIAPIVVRETGPEGGEDPEPLRIELIPLLWRLLLQFAADPFVMSGFMPLLLVLLRGVPAPVRDRVHSVQRQGAAAASLHVPIEFYTAASLLAEANKAPFPPVWPAGCSSMPAREVELRILSLPADEHTGVVEFLCAAVATHGLGFPPTGALLQPAEIEAALEQSVEEAASDADSSTISADRAESETLQGAVRCLAALFEGDGSTGPPATLVQQAHACRLGNVLVTACRRHRADVDMHRDAVKVLTAINWKVQPETHGFLFHE